MARGSFDLASNTRGKDISESHCDCKDSGTMVKLDFLLISMRLELLPLYKELQQRALSVGMISDWYPDYSISNQTMTSLKNNFAFWSLEELNKRSTEKIFSFQEIANRIRSRHSVPNLRMLYFPEHIYRSAWCNHTKDFYYASNHSVREDLYEKTIKTFLSLEQFFEHYEISYVIMLMGSEIVKIVASLIAAKKGIPSLFLTNSPISDDQFIIFPSMHSFKIREISNKKLPELTEKERTSAEEFIKNFDVEMRYPTSSHNALTEIENRRKAVVSYLQEKGLLRTVFMTTKSGGRAGVNILKGFRYSKLYCKPHFKNKFLYFPLHYHCESRLTLWDTHCWRQEYLVEYAARSLPQNYELYVKVHPHHPTSFPYEFLRNIKKISNVKLIPPSYSSREIIQKSEGVIVINSTAGFEALMIKKPVVVLGDTFYEWPDLTYTVKDLRMLPKAIRSALDSIPNESQLTELVSNILRVHRKGRIFPSVSKDRKVIVDGIIDYMKNETRSQ